MLFITLLGTGGTIPLKNRWLTSLWVEKDGCAVLVDCGEGTQIAIAEKEIKLSHLEIILITHLHADHITGLPGLLLSLGNCGKTGKIRIIGPEHTRKTVSALRTVCPVLPFEVEITEISSKADEDINWNGIQIKSFPVKHDLPCLAYSFTENKGKIFNPKKAKELNIDVKYWKILHSGQNVEIDGQIYTSEMVTDGDKGIIKVTYITDTKYFDELIDFAANSDLLVSECMYADDEYIEKMNEKGHMVLSQSVHIAKEAGAKELWLTHFSPAFSNVNSFEEQAKKMFHNISIKETGNSKELK